MDGDFVITNGAEFFNRPLYCMNSAFRVDGGDKPEFSLYLPGRGGNLRLGIRTPQGVKWLNDTDQIIARYHAGSLIYKIKDALLMDNRELRLTILPLSETKGFIVRAEMNSAWMPIELIWAFGGANGMRGLRGGDIGCEREPVSQFFQLHPNECRDNEFSVATNTFVLRGKSGVIAGVASLGATYTLADANSWENPKKLFGSVGLTNPEPVVVGNIALPHERPVYLVIQQIGDDGRVFDADELPRLFSAAENHRREIAERVVVETPDPFINAAVPALNIAADAIWDSQQQSFMHGAVAWRQRLLGWRGICSGDELGWHERTAAHFAGYAKQQNTNPIPDKIPAADEQFNLARNESALHSNGDMTKTHYDMNLLAVDAFFRHMLWTCDTNYAAQMWPVIERHLAWERRLFRRLFGDDHLPLYEAYAAIWASDDLNYNGGGTAHASALNFYENKMAAAVAAKRGMDYKPYECEADLISQGMNKYLWLSRVGNFAESKDYLGLQLVHPNSGLWTFYHTMDSEISQPEQAWQMSRWIDENIAHIPICGENVLDEKLYVLPETGWMPYQWSLNNVVVAENMYTALGFWQANRPETAFPLFKGTLLDTMFLGLCPGNVGCMTSHDTARGEAQRDFGDGIGATSRALVEGLFGVKPNALIGELKIVPGFPAQWDFARMVHPDFNFEFRCVGATESFGIEPKFPVPMKLDLEICARTDTPEVTVNGKHANWNWCEDYFGFRRIEVTNPPADKFEVVVNWKGVATAMKLPHEAPQIRMERPAVFDWSKKVAANERFETVNLAPFFNDKVAQIFHNDYRSPRSPYCSLATPKQGIGGWCEPNASFDVDDSGLRAVAAHNGEKIILPGGVPLQTPGAANAKNIIFTSQWDNYPREVSVPLAGRSSHALLLMAGSTSAMQSRFDNGEVVVTYTDGSAARLALRNPETWWPIDQDYFVDDFAFRLDAPLPPRVDLQTGRVRLLDAESFKGKGGKIPGGAATVLQLPLDSTKELKSLTVRALANEVVIGLMSVTLER
jgi:hypothetical protein